MDNFVKFLVCILFIGLFVEYYWLSLETKRGVVNYFVNPSLSLFFLVLILFL